ncbi:MAG TPA: hypothetical protein V6C78_16120 [Crinalium sp.]
MTRIVLIGLSLLLGILAIACSPSSSVDPVASSGDSVSVMPSNSPVASSASAQPPATLITALSSWLSSETGIPADEMSVKTTEVVEWPDACLGVSRPDELCAQVITSGYRFIVATPRGDYIVHSDRSGRSFRIARSP